MVASGHQASLPINPVTVYGTTRNFHSEWDVLLYCKIKHLESLAYMILQLLKNLDKKKWQWFLYSAFSLVVTYMGWKCLPLISWNYYILKWQMLVWSQTRISTSKEKNIMKQCSRWFYSSSIQSHSKFSILKLVLFNWRQTMDNFLASIT